MQQSTGTLLQAFCKLGSSHLQPDAKPDMRQQIPSMSAACVRGVCLGHIALLKHAIIDGGLCGILYNAGTAVPGDDSDESSSDESDDSDESSSEVS